MLVNLLMASQLQLKNVTVSSDILIFVSAQLLALKIKHCV